MQVEAIVSEQVFLQVPSQLPQAQIASSGKTDFADLVSSGIEKVNSQLVASEYDLQRIASGDMQDLHQAMIRLEQSKLSFQLMLQVRNRLLESYQDIMKMQI